MLYDSKAKNYYRYHVYLDDNIGIDKPIQKYIINTDID